MEQLNRIELKGSVGSIRFQTFDGAAVANMTLCTNYAYRDKDGSPVIEQTWHNIVAWEGKEIQGLDKIQKGAKLHVVGRLRTRSYSGADGVDRTITEVMVKKLKVIDGDDSFSYEM